MTQPRIRVPSQARKGEVIEIKTLISHPMETGHRRDTQGQLIPRHIIHTFTCTYNGTEVFRADWHPAVAANPYLAFCTVAAESGPAGRALAGSASASTTSAATTAAIRVLLMGCSFHPIASSSAPAGVSCSRAAACDACRHAVSKQEPPPTRNGAGT